MCVCICVSLSLDYIEPVNRGGYRVQLYLRNYDLHPGSSSTNLVLSPKEHLPNLSGKTTTGVLRLTHEHSRSVIFTHHGGGRRERR